MPASPLYLRSLRTQRTKRVQTSRPTHRMVRFGGKLRRMPVAHFWKDVIGVGSYVHPVTGEKFVVTEERIKRWLKRYEQMRKAGIEIPTPVDHSDRAEDNRGFVVAARRTKDGTLQLLHEVIGHDGVKLAMRNRCSVFIEPDYRDEKGRRWGEVIAHSAFTPKPVISGQGEFVPFAASRSGGKTTKVPVFYLSDPMAKRNKRRNRLKLSKAVDAADPAFAVDDTVTLPDGTTGTVKKAVDVTAYEIEDENGETLPWQIEDDLAADDGTQLSRGRNMKTKKRGKNKGNTSLSPKQVRKARKILNVEDDVELSDAEILSRLLSLGKLRKAADDALDGDEEDDLEDDDEVDDDEEGDDDDDAVDELDDEDEEDDDEEDDDEEEDEDDDEASGKTRKSGKAKRRQAILAKRRQSRVRELAGSVGSLSRVPKGTDPATLAMIKRSLKTERRRAIEKGAISPETDEALAELLFTKGKPNGLALSRVAGSSDPLAFRIYDILRRNKPKLPVNRERTNGQGRLVLSREDPTSGDGTTSKKEQKEIDAVVAETRKHLRGQAKPGKKEPAAKLD